MLKYMCIWLYVNSVVITDWSNECILIIAIRRPRHTAIDIQDMLLKYDLLINSHDNKRANKPGNYWINIDLEEFNADFQQDNNYWNIRFK